MEKNLRLSKTLTMQKETLPEYKNVYSIMHRSQMKSVKEKIMKFNLFEKAGKKAAFTLAETLITLTVLGIIAAIAIPSLIQKQYDNANRTKLKKAMVVYERVLNNMIIDSDIKSADALTTEFPIDNVCTDSKAYFKIVKQHDTIPCRFQTAEKIWWDITDIRNPIVILKDDYKDLDLDAANGLKVLAKESYTTNKYVFALAGYIENGIVRINDKGVAAGDNATYLDKVYAYIASGPSGSVGNISVGGSEPIISNSDSSTGSQTGDDPGDNPPVNDSGSGTTTGSSSTPKGQSFYETYRNINDYNQQIGYNDFNNNCSNKSSNVSCFSKVGPQSQDSYYYYDENGTIQGAFLPQKDRYIEYERDSSGNILNVTVYTTQDNQTIQTTYTNAQFYDEFMTNNRGDYCVFTGNTYTEINGQSVYGCYNSACLARGTMVTLADGSQKAIQDVDYNDDLKVWDFDNGCLASAKPLWIMVSDISDRYNLLTFSDGRTLKTINQHRIFNKEAGKYTYPMTDDTPIGTTTLLDDGTEVTLVKKEVVEQPVEFYNIITEYHFNMFGNGISTSNRFSNMYPIENLKYVKDNRELTPYEEFEGISYEWYQKLRLAEQPLDINRDGADKHDNSLNGYVLRLMATNKRQMAVV